MATWIVHLRLAENLLDGIAGLDEPNFALGNVAPDSGVPDEKWEKFNPPPEITHFRDDSRKTSPFADLDFYRKYLGPISGKGESRERSSFLLGYFFHLVTDNLWHREIVTPTYERFAPELKADPNFVWTIKHDWYGLDYQYVREHPESIFWNAFLRSRYTEGFLDFLPEQAVEHQLTYIKDLYQKTDDETEQWWKNRPGIYLTKEQMDRFVEKGARQLVEMHHYLRENTVPPGCSSILERRVQ